MRMASGDSLPDGIAEHVASCRTCADLFDEMQRNADLSGELGRLTPAARRRGDDAISDLVPGYKVRGELHRGGQGVVYEAVQEGSNRRVAVKMLLQGGFATTRQRIRFEREIEIAANLKHPCIVTVFEPLSLSDGRLGYAMELIEGDRLDAWAAAVRGDVLSAAAVRRMLAVMSKVCDAVSYAHGRAIIHRDLKPPNVLVDGDDVPHVLDFGIAKATENTQADAQSTRTGEFLGTLAYAAPEQVSGEAGLVDVRTDVFALGLMLRELLTGTSGRVLAGAMAEVIEGILSAEPKRPSTMARAVDDDVDVIVMKATARDPERRYQTVEALRDDIDAWMAGRPISAKRDSRLYVMRKTMWRYRVALAVAAVIMVLAGGFVVHLVQSNRELQHKTELSHDGLLLRGELDEIAKQLDREFESAEAKQQQIATLRPRLDTIASELEAVYRSEPLLEAGLQAAVGGLYRQMSIFEPAQAHLERALEIRRRELGVKQVETWRTMRDLAELYRELGEIQGGEQTEASRELLEEALDVSSATGGATSELTLSIMTNLARVYYDEREYAESRALYERAHEGLRTIGAADSVDALRCETGLALLEHEDAKRLRRSDSAEDQAEGARADAASRESLAAALERQKSLLGVRHLLTQKTMNNLALAHVLSDPPMYEEAERLWSQLLEARDRTLGRHHKRTVTTLANLGELYVDMGEAAQAVTHLPNAIDELTRLSGEGNLNVLNLWARLGEAYGMLDRCDDAERCSLRAVKGMRATIKGEPDDRQAVYLGRFLMGYGRVLIDCGHGDGARGALEEARELLPRRLGTGHPLVREVDSMLANLPEGA